MRFNWRKLKRREVSKEEGKNFARQNKTLFFETSAKKNSNVVECFEELLQQIYNTRRKNPGSENLTESIVLKKQILKKHEVNENSLCCWNIDFIFEFWLLSLFLILYF